MGYRILHGDSIDRLKEFPENHFDSCIMDGPYGLGFMGKEWDTFKQDYLGEKQEREAKRRQRSDGRSATGFQNAAYAGHYDTSKSGNVKFQLWFESISREIYRVLKPGAYFLSFGGTRTYHRMICGIEDAGFEIRDCIQWVFASGFPKSYNLNDELGSALKPAWEPICMARKPPEGTIKQNYKKWGTGVLNIASTRINLNGDYKSKANGRPSLTGRGDKYDRSNANQPDVLGRWPANFIHDGSDEVVSLLPETKSGLMNQEIKGGTFNVFSKQYPRKVKTIGDSGSAARFFYCAKTSRYDRNEGLEMLKKKPLLWSSGTKNPGTFQSSGTDKSSQNSHPTVKPTKLMRYLSILVTPPGGEVLDPCCGSGSTGKGAILEGFNFTGIDREKQWVDISDLRCAHASKVREKLMRAGKQLVL